LNKIKKLIKECENNNLVDMYNTFSEIMAEKTLNCFEARKANIMMEDNIEHDGSCDEVHPDKSHQEWEEDQEEFVQNEQMNNISTVPTDDMQTKLPGMPTPEREYPPEEEECGYPHQCGILRDQVASYCANEHNNSVSGCIGDGCQENHLDLDQCLSYREMYWGMCEGNCDPADPRDPSWQGPEPPRPYSPKPYWVESVISKIQECYSSKMPVNINIDGEQLQINPTFARDIILLHDELNEENQAELRELIESDNIESFAKVMKFTEDRN